MTTENTEIKIETTGDIYRDGKVYGNNVILFPSDRIVRPRTVEQFNEAILDRKLEFIELTIRKHSYTLFNRLALDGIEIREANNVADFVFVVDALRSALYRMYEIEHPIQGFVDEELKEDVSDIVNEIYEYPRELTD